MHFTSLFIIASTLLPIVFALPLAVPKDQSLSKCSTDVGSDIIPCLGRRFEVESDGLLDRDISDLFRRARRKGPKGNPPKITFGNAARKDLDDLGLHGKERRKAKKYHKNLIKSYMKTLPDAHTAEITRIAHVGGTDPNDPLHATVKFRKMPPVLAPGATMSNNAKKKLVIASTYTDAAGVARKGEQHHVYPNAAQHKLPTSYAAGERKRLKLSASDPIPHKI